VKTVLRTAAVLLALLVIAVAVAWFGFLKPAPPPISAADRARLTLMPLPAELKLRDGVLALAGGLAPEFTGLSTPRLERAVARFTDRLPQDTDTAGESPSRLRLDCACTAAAYPALGDDESYEIEVSEREIRLTARTETGILHGLETLPQLAHEENGQWVLPQLTLRDRPRFPWRGLLIDVGRHWMPKDVILRNLDAMAAVKLNVLHWHLTEYQGFRVESRVFPELHEKGSGGEYYTQDDVREIVEYAADRGIRVVPEFDLPGHTTSWFVGHPELASAAGPYVVDTAFGVLAPVMDPTREEVYAFLDRFFGEMAELFPDAYVHIGGDEVVATHWEESERIRQYMAEQALEDTHALQNHFTVRLQQILAGHGKAVMGWDEIMHPDLPAEGVVVQAWRDHASLWASARAGNPAVLSSGYYLDHQLSAGYHYGVDPGAIPGAVTVEIDAANWRGWSGTLALSDDVYQFDLYFFGAGEELRGIMTAADVSTGIPEVTREGDRLRFPLDTRFGTVKFDVRLVGDSIMGTARIAVFDMEVVGSRSGGSDMPDGQPLPEFRTIEPLTPEEEANLLGGEACMWSELVDATTIDSRVWPRTAAVAEKLWSPRALTDDTDDMYRRLLVIDERLAQLGMMHRSYRDAMLGAMVPPQYLEPLRTLVAVLEEDKYYNRMALYGEHLYTTTPLDRIADAAPPESYVAYRFGQDVDAWIETRDTAALARLREALETWAANHERLKPAFAASERAREAETHSGHLAQLADLGLEALTAVDSPLGAEAESEELFSRAQGPHGGTILAVVQPVRRLVEAAAEASATR
jgi:hexosaminidase